MRKSEQHYGKTAKQVSAKLRAVLPRNLDYNKLKSISNTIIQSDVKIHQEIHVSQVPMFKFTPITMNCVDKHFPHIRWFFLKKIHKFDKK